MSEASTTVPAPVIIDRPIALWQQVLRLAVPVWAQQFLHLAVSLSDAYLAGRWVTYVGSHAVSGQAAQTNANYLQWFVGSFAVLVSVGATALVARFVGGHERPNAIRTTHQALILALLFGLAGGAAGFIGADQLMALLQLTGDAQHLAADYLRPIFAALPLQMVLIVGIACLVGAGDTLTGMWIMSGVTLVNIPLAWSFSSWLGLPGIAVGTAVSHGLGCIAILAVLFHGRAGLQITLAQLRPDRRLMWRLLRISIPAGFDSLIQAAGQLLFLTIINGMATEAVAAHGIALRWEGLAYLSAHAFGVAAMTLVGQYLGARRPDLAARSGWTALGISCIVVSAMCVIFFLLARPMFELFCPDECQLAVIEQGVPALRVIAFAMPLATCCFVLPGALRGAGDTRVPILFSIAGFFGVRLPLAYLLTGPLDWGLLGAWYAMVADLMLRGGLLLWRFRGGYWKTLRV